MKRNYVSKFWIFVCVNIWYIPFLALIFGAKVSLISFLVRSTVRQRDDRNSHLTSEIIKIIQLRQSNPIVHKVKRESKRSVVQNLSVPATTAGTRQRRQVLSEDDFQVLNDLENSVIRPTETNRTDPEGIWLVFNHVPWGGGEVVSALLQDLEESNRFKHVEHEYQTPWPRFLLEQEQESLVNWFEYQHLAVSYERHFYFVNFPKHQKFILENPIYVNMIQNPASRLLTQFQWKRKSKDKAEAEIQRRNKLKAGSGSAWFNLTFDECVLKSLPECSFETGIEDFTSVIPFFCGQSNSTCVLLNNKWALQQAKFNIEKYYSVVGILEKLYDSLRVLENYIPRFFFGASNYDVEKPPVATVSPQVLKILRKKLPFEFEFYNFAQQRLQLQLDYISEAKKT